MWETKLGFTQHSPRRSPRLLDSLSTSKIAFTQHSPHTDLGLRPRPVFSSKYVENRIHSALASHRPGPSAPAGVQLEDQCAFSFSALAAATTFSARWAGTSS